MAFCGLHAVCPCFSLKIGRPKQIRKQGEKQKKDGWSVSPLKKKKRKAAAQRSPALSERKNLVFSVKRQAVCFEMRSISI